MFVPQDMTETEDAEGNIILIERIDGSGGVQACINGHAMAGHLEDVRVLPDGALDLRLHVDGELSEDVEVQPGGV